VPARRQGRQILLNDEPDSDDINSVVFMPQMVAQPLDLSPRHSRAQFPACVTEFLGRLTDKEQGVFDGVKGLVVRLNASFWLNASRSMPAINSSIRAMFSRISSKRWTGSLEGTHGLGVHGILHARFEGSLFHQFDRAAEEIGKLVLNADHIQERYLARLIEGREQIDV